jgi:hypothetical protein
MDGSPPPANSERMRAYAQIIQEASLREVEQWIPDDRHRRRPAPRAVPKNITVGPQRELVLRCIARQ